MGAGWCSSARRNSSASRTGRSAGSSSTRWRRRESRGVLRAERARGAGPRGPAPLSRGGFDRGGDPDRGAARRAAHPAARVALVVYALLPIVRNTYAGIAGVDPAIRDAGRGMGMTDWQLLVLVELPLGLGVILAGVRVATVVAVGTATIAAAIGAGGLGVYIFRGVATVNDTLILAGALPAALIALAADGLLGWAERRLAWRAR